MPRPARNFSKARKEAERAAMDKLIAQAQINIANKQKEAPASLLPTKTHHNTRSIDEIAKETRESERKAYLEELAKSEKKKKLEEDPYEVD